MNVHHTVKRFTVGTHRVVAPAELLPRITPLLSRVGVTRLANITGLDRIGIPTVAAIRPEGRTLSVLAGKGLTLDAAKASAAMEAIEVAVAEAADVPRWRARVNDVRGDAAVPLEHVPLRRFAILNDRSSVVWTWATNLVDGSRVAVPSDLVHLGEPDTDTCPFVQTSNGLASGAVFVEALLAALLEVVERDALACSKSDPTGLRRVRLETLTERPLVHGMLEQLAEAEVTPVVYDCTTDTGIPVFMARILDVHRHVGIFYGSGAHLDPEIALLRALAEAVQSRAVYISGARDDLSAREYARLRAHDSPAVAARLLAQPATVDASDDASLASATFEADIALVVERLVRIGLQHIALVNLTPDDMRELVSVVRVVAPGLAVSGVRRRLSASAQVAA